MTHNPYAAKLVANQLLGRGVRLRPNNGQRVVKNGRFIIGYHPEDNQTRYYDDVLVHQEAGDTFGMMDW